MNVKNYKIQVQEDHLERLANARPIQAIAELIWNAVDADASFVKVDIEHDALGHQLITVTDNGTGIPYESAGELFSKLGGSWKAIKGRSVRRGRMLHGKEGRGRFKALALGRVANWVVTFSDQGDLYQYQITLIRDQLVDVKITDPQKVRDGNPGVKVIISEPHRYFRSLDEDQPIQDLSELFAFYLNDYTDITIVYQGRKLDPSASIHNKVHFYLPPITIDDELFNIYLDIIEWKGQTERVVYLCDEIGFPFQRLQPKFHTPGFQFSAYIKSPYITKLHEAGVLDLAEMTPEIQSIYEAAQEQIKNYFKGKRIESARSAIEQWKADKIYPYEEKPASPVEEAERKVFDIIALNLSRRLTDFSVADPRTKAFQFRMLRQAIERGPKELQLILAEVMDLQPREQEELAKLLEKTSLSNIISVSKLISDRILFVNGLEAIIFDTD